MDEGQCTVQRVDGFQWSVLLNGGHPLPCESRCYKLSVIELFGNLVCFVVGTMGLTVLRHICADTALQLIAHAQEGISTFIPPTPLTRLPQPFHSFPPP